MTVAGFTAAVVACCVVLVAGSYALGYLEVRLADRQSSWWRWIADYAHWRAARPRFDSSAAFRRELALWREQRP